MFKEKIIIEMKEVILTRSRHCFEDIISQKG